MLPSASTSSMATSGSDSAPCASSARDGISVPAKPNAGRASHSGTLGSIACEARSATRGSRNAATRQTIGKPCAGNPHARFERGSCPFTDEHLNVKGQDLPMRCALVLALLVAGCGDDGGMPDAGAPSDMHIGDVGGVGDGPN